MDPRILAFATAALLCTVVAAAAAVTGASSGASSVRADANGAPFLTVHGTLPMSQFFQVQQILAGGWSRTELCGGGGGGGSDCALAISVTQNDPDPFSSECSLGALVQVDCLSQTNQDNYAQMVCVSSTSAGSTAMLFPQDSPNYAFNQTIWTGLRSETLGARAVIADAKGGAQAQAQGGGFVANPITAMLSPATFAAMEAVALRNLEPSDRTAAAPRSPTAAGPATLPINLILLNQQKLLCASAISYTIVARAVNNSLCASAGWIPPHTQVVPATNHTNASTTVVPGVNVTTPVACFSERATCLIQPADLADPSNVNTTALCLCDRGFEYEAASGACIERSVDLTNLGALARPFNYAANGSDPSAQWRTESQMNPKGSILQLSDVSLNVSQASASRQRIAPRIDGDSNVGDLRDSSAASASSYWFARANISRAMQDLSLVVHVLAHLEDLPPGAAPPPMQISFSPDFYPAAFVNTPLGCLNASDLTVAARAAAGSAAAAAGDVIIDASSMRIADSGAAAHRQLDSTQTSCSIFYASFPDVGLYASPRSFKLLFQPAMVQGFLDRAGVGPSDESTVAALFLSVYFEANLRVDVRTWWQADVDMMVPLHPRSALKKRGSGDAAAGEEDSAEEEQQATNDETSAAPAPAAAAASLAAGAVTYSGEIAGNQSWVQQLLENELVYFTFNETGPAAWGPEDASLYFVLNDTSCTSGAMSQGWFAPHWWAGQGNAAYGPAVAAGMNPGGGPPPPLAPFVPAAPAVQGLSGGCIRPNQRYLPTAAGAAGYFGKLFSTCAAAVELNVWHISPYALDTRLVNQWSMLQLNATGSGCYREFTLAISSSIPNDLLLTVDQADAQILLRMAPNTGPNPPPSYPTPSFQYNSTAQYDVAPEDDAGDSHGWVQRSIAYLDLSVTQVWYVSVFLDPSGGASEAAYPARAFRLKLSWATESSFAHFSKTLIIIFSCVGSLAFLLLLLAVKLRVDSCRRSDQARRSKTSKMQEKIRLMQAGKSQEYMRM